MNSAVWYTDTHLDMKTQRQRDGFVQNLMEDRPDSIFLTGDITNGRVLEPHLKMVAQVGRPTYFVLGNHDYWGSSFEETHQKVRSLKEEYPNLVWLSEAGIVKLTEGTALIGTEGWYDGAFGQPDFLHLMWDWINIREIRQTKLSSRLEVYRSLAQKAATYIAETLESALRTYKKVIILTHFPPWVEATKDRGTFFENVWLPYNVSERMGKAIERVMIEHPEKEVLVLAGHTHTERRVRILDNLEVRVNGAHYIGRPRHSECVDF